jgi:alpha-galactosidase
MVPDNDHTIRLRINRDTGCFGLAGSVRLENCEMWVSGRAESGAPFSFPVRLDERAVIKSKTQDNREVHIYSGYDPDSALDWQVEFTIPQCQHMLAWRLSLSNRSNSPRYIRQIGMLHPAANGAGNLTFPAATTPRDMSIFCNGWQSWSYSAAYRGDQRMCRSRLGILQEPMVLNTDTPLPRQPGMFGSDFFTVVADTQAREGMLLGFLSQKEQFGSLGADLRSAPGVSMWANGDDARLDPGQHMTTDIAAAFPIQIDHPDPLEGYIEEVARENGIGTPPAAPAGWCTWYQYYQGISAEIIRSNLHRMEEMHARLPLDLVQIDDGFQVQVGYWLRFSDGFPDGVAGLAREIKASGRRPGLWLAPFILHPASRTARDHPDWLLRNADGRLARAGFGWNSLAIALDLTVPAALDYAASVVRTAAQDWGYPYLKLDFLYAAALKGRYRDPTRTRAQVLRAGMQALREAAGENTFLLGCGAPLGSVLGLVDGMRIGADVSPSWRPAFHGIGFPFREEPHMPSARNAIQNTLTRAPLHDRWWVNDADCLLVRPDSRLTLDEVRSLAAVIALTGGPLLLSDDLSRLTPERQRLAACLLPLIGKRARVMDWMDAQTPTRLRLDLKNRIGCWSLLAAFNWSDQEKDLTLQPADFDLPADRDYFTRSFWDNRVWMARAGQPLFSGRLPAHASLLLSLRAFEPGKPLYLGSDLHISQGLEVADWSVKKGQISLTLDLGRTADGCLDIYLPDGLKRAELDGVPVNFEPIAKGCWRISVKLANRARLRLTG